MNALPQITLSAVQDVSERAGRAAPRAPFDRILAQVEAMAAAAGGMHSVLARAHKEVGELVRPAA